MQVCPHTSACGYVCILARSMLLDFKNLYHYNTVYSSKIDTKGVQAGYNQCWVKVINY